MTSTLADTRPARHPDADRITATSTFGAVTLKGLPGSPRDLADLLLTLYADPDVRELLERSITAADALDNACGPRGSDGLRESKEIAAADAEVEQVSIELRETLADLVLTLPPVELPREQAITLRELLIAQRLGQGKAAMSSNGWRSA